MKRTKHKAIVILLNKNELRMVKESQCSSAMYSVVDKRYTFDHIECHIGLLIGYLTNLKYKTIESQKFLNDLRKLNSDGFALMMLE